MFEVAIPVLRAPAGTAWDQMTTEQQDQAFRDSIPHQEHLDEGYYMVGCLTCDADHLAADSAGTCERCLALGLLPAPRA